MEKEIHTKQYKTDPRIITMLGILYARNYIVIGKDVIFEKLLKQLEEENDTSTL